MYALHMLKGLVELVQIGIISKLIQF